MLQSRLKTIILEVFKAQKGISPSYIQDIFKEKKQPNLLRNPVPLIQEKRDSTNNGLKTFSYLGSKLWNDLPPLFKMLDKDQILLLKSLLKEWAGPDTTNYQDPLL